MTATPEALAEAGGPTDAAFEAIFEAAPEAYRAVRARFAELGGMRSVLERMPKTSSRTRLYSSSRDGDTLVAELLRRDRGERLLYLPARAVFGRAVAVAEAQAWSALVRACSQAGVAPARSRGAEAHATEAVLGLMAEDAYRDMLDGDAPERTRAAAARRLVALWDARPDGEPDEAAEALVAVWASRRQSPPAFGTLIGSSELMGLSMGLDDRWFAFAGERFPDRDVSEALAEFLFGLSHEELGKAQAFVSANGPMGPEGLSELTGGARDFPEAASPDPRDLYRFYEARRSAAKARQASGSAGPKATLEELYLRWTIERCSI